MILWKASNSVLQIISNRLQNCPSGEKSWALLLSTDTLPLWDRNNNSQLYTNYQALLRSKVNSVATRSMECKSVSKFQFQKLNKGEVKALRNILGLLPPRHQSLYSTFCAGLCLSTLHQKWQQEMRRGFNWAHPEVSLYHTVPTQSWPSRVWALLGWQCQPLTLCPALLMTAQLS